MNRYIFTDQKIEDEYKYIFLCGTQYVRKSKKDKRNVLRKFLREENVNYRPVILEDNFIFTKDSSRRLLYDDIHMKDLYQVEMLMNYLSDNNIIVHESISTGAETGLFLSEPSAIKKTCLLVPDPYAVEEKKIGQFINLAFLRDPERLKVITFYPKVENNIISEHVRYWHTYFYENKIGVNLGRNILQFIDKSSSQFRFRFTKSKKGVNEGRICYMIRKKRLEITILPRILLCCIATIFNIDDLSQKIFSAEEKELREYIEDIKECLLQVFINSIEEETGTRAEKCSVNAKMNVARVYIAEVIGMCLYLFQAADFIRIEKDIDYSSNNKVKITRRIIVYRDGSNHFFYEKYKKCLRMPVDTQIM